MARNKALTLSIVIPAYNEEHHLKACLDSIAKQSEMPDEVIVVDNNSTDKTAEIAKSYRFVKVLSEKRQGVVFARNRGFDAARSDIIGRFNADVILEPDWVKKTKSLFTNNQSHMMAGYVQTKLLPSVEWPYTSFWTKAFYRATRAFFGTTLLWGANMAITKQAWEKVKHQAATNGDELHEDVDIGLCIYEEYRHEAPEAHDITVRSREQSYHYWPKLNKYISMYYRTYQRHIDTLKDLTYRPGPHSLLDIGALTVAAVFILTSLLVFPFAWAYRHIH